MKKVLFIVTLMLLCSVSVWAAKHDVRVRTGLEDANKNGTFEISPQSAEPGTRVTVYCKPDTGYGLSSALNYATKNTSGEYSSTLVATNESTDPADRANRSQMFVFDMPDADVEVWATFVPLRTLVIHQTSGGRLEPLYGYKDSPEDTVIWNVPLQPLKLRVVPDTVRHDLTREIVDIYELVDVNIENVDQRSCQKSSKEITVYMPNEEKTIHVTPVFGKDHYKVNVTGNTAYVKVSYSPEAPKAREEVEVTLTADKGYIPKELNVKGCKSWWRVGQPQRDSLGRWTVAYRFKVDLQDVTIEVDHERVYSFSVNDTKNTGRLQTYIPELIPGFPGVARYQQQVPVLFMMPKNYSVSFTAKDAEGKSLAPLVYHNALQNSFADQGMAYWTESTDYVNNGLPMRVDTDSTGNKCWRTSVKNSMSQRVSLADYTFPKSAIDKNKLSIATIASINPCQARSAKARVVAIGGSGADQEMVVADFGNSLAEGWQTVFKTGQIDATAKELSFQVDAEGESPDKKRSYDGPMFDDFCLLLPASAESIRDEDVLVFTMGRQDVTIDYTPLAKQGTVSVVQQAHATVTLRNASTGEEGTAVKAMENDIIEVKGKYDEGYSIVKMTRTEGKDSKILTLDSIDVANRETSYHFVKRSDKDATIKPAISTLKVNIDNNYGGNLSVDNNSASEGEKVVVTVKPDDGCRLRQIRTSPAGIVTLTADSVDAATGAGTYSFIMPAARFTLVSEFIVPITDADQLEEIDEMAGEFVLDADLDLGNDWDNEITLSGDFNGNGHRITYGGETSLFDTVDRDGSVRHLYVSANLEGSDSNIGAIATNNEGVIEDCEVSGSMKSTEEYSSVAGVAVQNGPQGGVISHCHIVCDVLEGPMAYGIAHQESGATIKGNVFNGKFVNSGGNAYMMCNDEAGSTIDGNYYVATDANAWTEIGNGMTAAQPEALVDMVKDLADSYPVFAASIKNKYNAYTVTIAEAEHVEKVSLSPRTAALGTIVRGALTVTGNNYLESVTVSAPDGSDPQVCTFEDDTQNGYTFSFAMPAHDALVTFKTQEGTLVYDIKQFVDIDGKDGTFILARDIELNNWNSKVSLSGNFYGRGHTIKYGASGSCQGLFYTIKKGARLEGLRVVGKVESDEDCAGIAYRNNGTISDCHFSGMISKIASPTLSENRVAAIAYKVGKKGLIDHCSAAGLLTSPDNQAAIDQSPLCAQSDANITNSVWISPSQTGSYQQLLQQAEAEQKAYPVYAQGIIDQVAVSVVTGSDTVKVLRGQTIPELTITDGEPFVASADVSVNRIVYKRKAMKAREPWVLPFGFDQIAGTGTFEYYQIVDNNNMPDLSPATALTFSDAPLAIAYKANEPWMVRTDGSGDMTYVLTSSEGPVTVKATYNDHIAQYSSIQDIGNVYVTYDSIPAMTAQEGLMYVWDVAMQQFVLADAAATPDGIQPFRYYLQFYNKNSKEQETYADTWWAKNEKASSDSRTATSSRAATAPRRLSAAVADGWQPVFLDPRQPQSVTARMLDHYEVACLADVRADVVGGDGESSLSVVSLVYQMVDSRTALPSALPLLVRAKRSDAEPLADAKTGAELDSLLTQALVQMLMDDEGDDDDEVGEADLLGFDMPHYWCASFDSRLDIWPLPAPVQYADLSYFGCMVFDDNYFDQSFNYATDTDKRSTAPMSYCITLLNTDTYELLPLMGDRVYVEFVGAGDATGISLTPGPSPKGEGSGMFNLSGQRVNDSYKGIVIQNGRKIYKK